MKHLENELTTAGFDLLQWFSTEAFVHPTFSLEDYGRSSGALALVVGNTKALWERFLASNPTGPHPLDHYTERVLHASCQPVAPRHTLYFAHTMTPAAIPIQRIAHSSGLAQLGPGGLCIHPDHGPWFALRAVVTFDAPGPAPTGRATGPCASCPGTPCVEALQNALDLGPDATWRHWLTVRDVCPEGRGSRYGDSQLIYHYTKDPRAMRSDP